MGSFFRIVKSTPPSLEYVCNEWFPLDYLKDDKGTVTHFLFHAPGSDMKFVPTDTTNP